MSLAARETDPSMPLPPLLVSQVRKGEWFGSSGCASHNSHTGSDSSRVRGGEHYVTRNRTYLVPRFLSLPDPSPPVPHQDHHQAPYPTRQIKLAGLAGAAHRLQGRDGLLPARGRKGSPAPSSILHAVVVVVVQLYQRQLVAWLTLLVLRRPIATRKFRRCQW